MHVSCQAYHWIWVNCLCKVHRQMHWLTNSNLSLLSVYIDVIDHYIFFQSYSSLAKLYAEYNLWQHHSYWANYLRRTVGYHRPLRTHRRITLNYSISRSFITAPFFKFELRRPFRLQPGFFSRRTVLPARTATAGEENRASFFNRKCAALTWCNIFLHLFPNLAPCFLFGVNAKCHVSP